MTRLWSAFVALTSRQEPALGLAIFRIAIGLVMLYSIASMVAAGLVDVLWIDAADGGMQQLRGNHWLLHALGGPTAAVMRTLVPVGLLLSLLVAVGAGGRLTLLAAAQVYAAIVRANPTIIGGYDHLITNALWLLFLGGASLTLSVDSRLRCGRWQRSNATLAAWPRYLAVFQLLVVYTTTGLNKLGVPWTPFGDFSALYWVYQEPTWRRFDMGFSAEPIPYFLLQVATALTWFWEVTAILLLVFFYYRSTSERSGRIRALVLRRDLRLGFVAVGIVVHTGILLTLNVGPFSWVSLAYYLCFFHPNEVIAFGRKLRLGARPSPKAANSRASRTSV